MKAEFVDEKVSTSDSMPLGAVRFSAKGSVHLPSASNIEEVIRNGSVRSCPGHSIAGAKGSGPSSKTGSQTFAVPSIRISSSIMKFLTSMSNLIPPLSA